MIHYYGIARDTGGRLHRTDDYKNRLDAVLATGMLISAGHAHSVSVEDCAVMRIDNNKTIGQIVQVSYAICGNTDSFEVTP